MIKKKQKILLASGAVLFAVLLAGGTVFALHTLVTPVRSSTDSGTTSSSLSVDTLTEDSFEKDGDSDLTVLTPDETIPKEESEAKNSTSSEKKTAETPALSITAASVTKTVSAVSTASPADADTVSKAIASSASSYSCGSQYHHCDGPETHAFIVNLEKKGCSMCGSHHCSSFYAVNDFGHAVYDPTKCPSYSEEEDPVRTCSVCHKKVGDGTEGTCVRFIQTQTCPNCREEVKGGCCHTCETEEEKEEEIPTESQTESPEEEASDPETPSESQPEAETEEFPSPASESESASETIPPLNEKEESGETNP